MSLHLNLSIAVTFDQIQTYIKYGCEVLIKPSKKTSQSTIYYINIHN